VSLLLALPLGGVLTSLGEDEAAAQQRPIDRVRQRTPQRNRKQRNHNNKTNNTNNNNNKKNNKNNNGGGGRGNLGAGNCLPPTTNDQPTDLQQAINTANPFANLVLCGGVFLAAGLRITQDVSLIGAGTTGDTPTLLSGSSDPFGPNGPNGTNTSGVLGVVSGNVFISNLVITGANGDVPAIGLEGGSLTLAAVRVGGNPAGGIVNLGGTLRLTQGTRVVGNGSDAEGGGILHRGGTTTVESGCTIQGNTATDGGGIFDATATTGDVQLGDSLIVRDNKPNNCSPAGAVQNCNN
jgi:hypothetical protein